MISTAMFATPGFVPALNTGGALTTPPQPAPVSYGGVLMGAVQTYIGSGGNLGAVAGSVGGALGGAGGIVGAAGSVLGAIGKGGKLDMATGASLGATIGTVIPGVGTLIGGAVGAAVGMLGLSLGTKSLANWRRTLGRVYRAALLGYVPPLDGAAGTIAQLVKIWADSGDASGSQFWDRVVSAFAVPTEKGGTKKGFGSGAPAGSKRAEAMPGFSSGLNAFLAAVGV